MRKRGRWPGKSRVSCRWCCQCWHVCTPHLNFFELKFCLYTKSGCSVIDKTFQCCLRSVKFRKQPLEVQTVMQLVQRPRLGQDSSRMTEISRGLSHGSSNINCQIWDFCLFINIHIWSQHFCYERVSSSHHCFCENTVHMCLCSARGIMHLLWG